METSMEKAKRLIMDFCETEYGGEYDEEEMFANMEQVGIAFLAPEYDEPESKCVEVFADLVHYSILTYVDGCTEPYERNDYSSLDELIEYELEWLDYESLVRVGL